MFAVAASSLFGGAAFGHAGLSLQELRARCHQFEADRQIMPFVSTYTCGEERTFWVKTGERPIPLPNDSAVHIRVQMKDGCHDTDWWTIPVPVQDNVGSCDVVEQWRASARTTLTFHSCAELDEIASLGEDEYCKARLQPVWDECDAERGQQPFGGTSSSSSQQPLQGPAGACEYAPTGLVRGCEPGGGPGQVPPLPPQVTTTSSSVSVPAPDVTTTSSIEQPAPEPSISTTSSSSALVRGRGVALPPRVYEGQMRQAPVLPMEQQPWQQGGKAPVMGGKVPPYGAELPGMGGKVPPMGGKLPPNGGKLPSQMPAYPQQGEPAYPQHGDEMQLPPQAEPQFPGEGQQARGQQGAYNYELGDIGAEVRPQTVKKGFWKGQYQVVELQEDPAEGSLLQRAHFKKGDLIARVNGHRIRHKQDLRRQLEAARKSGTVTIKYRDKRSERFIEKSLSNF